MSYVGNTISNLASQTAFANLTWGNYLMIAVACFFLYLAMVGAHQPSVGKGRKGIVPYLLVTFGVYGQQAQFAGADGFVQARIIAHSD